MIIPAIVIYILRERREKLGNRPPGSNFSIPENMVTASYMLLGVVGAFLGGA